MSVFFPIFVADTKLIFSYNFVASLTILLLKHFWHCFKYGFCRCSIDSWSVLCSKLSIRTVFYGSLSVIWSTEWCFGRFWKIQKFQFLFEFNDFKMVKSKTEERNTTTLLQLETASPSLWILTCCINAILTHRVSIHKIPFWNRV